MKVNTFYILRETSRYALIIDFGTFYPAVLLRNANVDLAPEINLYSVHFPHNVNPISDPEKYEHSFTDTSLLSYRFSFYGIRSFGGSLGNAYTFQVRFSRGYKRGNKLRMWSVREKFKLSRAKYADTLIQCSFTLHNSHEK